ncbi:RNA polymerase sigma-70 factor, ECF subfamily [Chitinophaga sp. CF118]|uniref:RNA polymerase sigma factor n=1 Tax=Chitinophaga sp. CF118 TaxID=1884367 RepID=UPI0008F425BE|nr:RNA polymerase sigma-70 factor [Chitinophaga sp. CF118]SFD08950.1 RNA polymerase sigma-70 factor, ECF subfamily [Chitinophaga sp. CF118]
MKNNNLYQDKEFFARIAEGDALAFRQLYDKYFQVLRFNAIKLLKSEYWSEEVTQETFLYIWESRATLTGIEHPAAWIFRVVANKCLDRMKRQGIELRAQYIINATLYENNKVEQKWQLDYNLLRKLIAEAVDRLPEQQRLVYKLQEQEELSYKEIGERLGISPNTVRNHLVRAFAAIRQHLIDHGEFMPLFFFLLFF